MRSTARESVLNRDRAIVMAALVVLTALALTYLLWLSATMSMPSMSDMPGMMMAPEIRPRMAGAFLLTFVMIGCCWALMALLCVGVS